MKLKQFIFALVAMLSFSFSAFAQTVTTAEALKAALESTTGSEVVLGGDITLPAQITVPKKTAHTLDLNGHEITGGIYVYGTLTINDNVGTGSITANTYVLNGAGGSKIILNGGRIYRASSWSVYTTGVFEVNGGVVENTIRVAGSGSIQLNGGTVTAIQVSSGNLNITDDAVVNGNLNIEKGAKSVNITDGTINGDVTIATEAADKVTVSGGTFKDAEAIKDYLPGGSALLQKPDGTYEIVAGLLKIGNEYYPTLAAALTAAQDGATIELINQEGSVIAMNGSLYGKNVTITGTATVDWSKGFLFVARGGNGDATLTFDNAQLTSASNQATYGIHVSGREKGTADKYDGTLVIKNSAIELDYLINKGAMTLDNSSLTVKNGFDLNGRPAKETENGEDANATLALNNNSKLVVNNHNGMGIGREGKGELTVDATSTFEHTQDFIVRANGTMDVKGTLVSNGKKLTNNGEVKFTATKLTDANIEGTGTTRFYNEVNFYGANSITTTNIDGKPFHLLVNEGANLLITRFVLGYDRNITVNGTIADASAFNPEGQTPSLKFNSTSGVSVGGTGTGNLTVNNAYIELGNSSWKNAQGTYDWDFVNSYVSATSFTDAKGADAATWDVTFDNSVLAAKNYIKNGKNVTYNFTNNSRGTTGSLRIDGELNIDATSSVVTTSQQNNVPGAVDEHGGINGTVNVAGNLTIGSNAKTQLEVLGGKVNVAKGATLALGNNTLTLDAASAMESAGNISGAITAADGANVAISGGTYTQDVNKWCADGFMTQQNADGSFGIAKAVAKIGDKKYASLEEAFKAATSGCTIDILSDVTIDSKWDCRYTGAKFLVPVTINGNGKTIKFTGSVNDMNWNTVFRFEEKAAVNNLTVDISNATGAQRVISAKKSLAVDGLNIVGAAKYGVIYGEGASATDLAATEIVVKNSTLGGTRRALSDNEGGKDVKSVVIERNTFNANVGVSAKENVTFTGNTVEGAYVNIKSYTAGNKLAVTATGNTLEANTDAAYNVIDAGGVVNAEGFNIVAKGKDFNGYTSADGIWGEVWGNARESFVIKVLDANGNVMGTTSLNNIGGIIDGDVNVSWNLKFDAASNNDEYWTMSWTTAPSISNMPAKVELWVDGVKVSGGPVVLNGPDDLNKIVAAVTDADGKIISCHTSVADAAAVTGVTNIALLRNTDEAIMLPIGVTLNTNGFTANNVTTPVASVNNVGYATLADAMAAAKAGDVVTVFAGTYAMPSMKAGITIEGKGEVVFEGTLTGTLENLTMKNIHIKGANAQRWAYAKGNLVFENVIFEATSVYALHFDGIAEGTNLTYKNCTIIGWAAMGGSPESCVFEGCTIKDNGTYGVIRTYFDAEIKNCTFDVANVNTNDAYQDGIHAVDGAEVVVDGCTNANENGTMKDLVNISGSSVITVDGKVYKNVAQIAETKYITIEDAIADWTNNTTLTLLADVTLSDVIQLSSTEYHVLDLGTYTMTAASKKDAIQIVNNGRSSASYALDIKADANNPGGITATGKAVVKTTGKSGVKDRPIIRFYNGVFTGTNVIYHSGSNGTNCPQFQFHGGVFNGTVYANRALIQFYGGTFNGSLQMSVDSSAYALISGGRFKQLSNLYGSALNSDKFTIGSAKGVYDREVYVDNEGYYVVAKAEPTEGVEADVATTPNSYNYFAYSKVGVEGQMAYTNVETALKNNTSATVTVYADEVNMDGINFKGTIIIPADEEVTITNAPADLKVAPTEGYFLTNNNGTYTSMRAVAKVGDKEFETVQKALQYAIDNSAAEVVVLTDVREKMVTDFDLVIKANLTIKAADKFTAEAPAKVEFYNEGTSMDFAVGTADGAERCTLTIAENVHFDLVDRVIWLGYYGNNVDVVVNGYFGGYQIWHGANTTVNNGGKLDSHGEAFVMRRDATLTANEGAKVNANYFQIYSGHINATGADITAGLVWVDGAHSYGSEGNVSFTLNNTSFVSNGEVKMTVAEGKNIPVSVTNGSAFTAKGKMTLANSVDVTVDATSSITHNNGQAFKLPVATINGLKYTSLQDAVNAVKNGETILLVDVVEENVTVVQAPDMAFTIDGNGKTMKGTITVNGKSAAYATAGLTIQNVNFNADGIAAEACINLGVKGDNNTRYTNGVTVDNCTFTGTNKDKTGIKNYTGGCKNVTITNSTATGMHSLAQFKTSNGVTLTKNTVTECKNGISVDGSTGVTVTECTVDVAGYGIRANGGSDVTVTSNNVKATTPVIVRSVTANSKITFNGENTMTPAVDGTKWMVVSNEDYEPGATLPAEASANVIVVLNDTGLDYTGIHGAGLAGKGTEAEPYLINNATELQMFRDKVNAGATKFNAPGVWVALNADIDLANAEWTVGIGDGHNYSFDGNFDGKNHTIKNLNIKPYADESGYLCGGLFGYTYGAVTIKNLTIENAKVEFTGAEDGKTYHNVGVLVGFANNKDGKLNVDNVTVKGDIEVNAPQTYGVGAIVGYSYRDMGAITNTNVLANEGSYIKGERFVGGITGYSYNGAVIDNCTVENLAITGENGVGGIAGLALNGNKIAGCTVKSVTVNGDKNVAYIVGELGSGDGGNVTVADNCNAPQPWVGGSYATGESFVATIGTQYYTSVAKAIEAAKENDVITLIADIELAESVTVPAGKEIVLDLNGKTITGTDNATGSFGLITNKGNLTINGEGAITLTATNNREWNAYSSVISNQPGGKLTVNGGTIQHLGGTDMAYAIDNLTNGKGTKAETIINGGAVKSTYRAVRQFLNGTEAQNILTVNGGTIEGANKSIWMQDPSKNSNTGTLTVADDAKLTGDVYLYVTAGSTAWPVEVSIAAAALQGESKVTTGNVPAGYDLALVNGTYGVYTGVAKIGTAYYDTLKDAVAAAQAGETITLIGNVEASEVILLGKSLTINGNGYKVTSNATRVFRVTVANTEVTLNDVNMVNTAVRVGTNDIRGISVDDVQNVKLTLNNCSVDFTDASANDWTYAVNVVGGDKHTITVDGGTYEGANVINVRSTNSSVVVKNATLNCLYPNNDAYMGACIYVIQNNNTSVEATGNTFNGDNAYAFNLGNGNPLTESDNIDNTKYVVAKIGDAYYTSIQDAIEAAQDGETVRLIQNVKMDTKTLATQNDGYAVLVNVNGKKVTIDLNGKKITVNAAAADLAGAKGGMLLGVFSADLGGHLTLTDNTDAKNGAVTVNVNDAKVYSVFVSESSQSDKSNSGKLTVNGGNYTTVGNVSNAMFFTDANEVITVNGGNFHCDGATTNAPYPWMFNTYLNNVIHVTVNGGTFNVDVNHQHRPFEVYVPETLAVKANGNGTWTVVEAEAYITEMLGATVNEAGEWGRKVGYATIAEAIAAVNELGNKVSIAKDLELTETVVVPADKTVVLDLNGKTVTMNDASGANAVLLKNNGNLTIMDGTEAKAGKLSFKTTTPSAANAYASNTISNYGTLTIESGNVENLSVGGGACYALDNYAGSTATINGGKLTAEKTAVRIFNWTNGEEAKATINMNGGEIYSKNGYGINVNSGNAPFVALNIAGGTITTDYADYKLAVYVVNKGTAENFTANVTGGTFNGIFALNGVTAQTMKQDAVAVSGGTFEGVTCYDDPAYGFVSGGTFKSVVDAKAVATGFICKDNGDGTFGVIVDPKHGMVAQIIRNDYYAENQYFATINEAVQAAVTGETVTLIADVETSAAGYATITDGYAVIVAVKEKNITLDLNGKNVTVTPTAEELANAEDDMLMSVFGMDTNGKLTLTGNGSVKVNANGANVYSLVAAYGEGSAVVIENGNYEADAVNANGSLIYAQQAECIAVMGGTFNLGNLGTGANGSPWIFNTKGQNYTGVKVVGGTYPTDINHQFWANEVLVPEAYALKNNGDGTWTVVDAVAYTNEKATSRGASWRHVGYASLEDAIAATGKYNCQNNTVTLIKDITLEPITVANGVTVAIDLNGKTISGTDSGTASFGLITNKGDLTINGTGAITLTATQNRGWSAYSSVISNQPGGKLTVNGGTIQHLGGTDMSYGIDNLTNGKGTYAETEINGGIVKSAYIAIRQFLNGVEAENILNVYGGTLEGKYSIFFQDPSKSANTGSLYVDAEAALNASVYLGVTEGSTEWPVEVEVAVAALKGESTVVANNVPANYHVTKYPTAWIVECSELGELTIDEADYAETGYINLVEKNVGELTYVRNFENDGWQSLYLPFGFTITEEMAAEFEFAYIYNASYKNKETVIDFVEVGAGFELAANYPYMIRAKEAGEKVIVVENAVLEVTKNETIDCSTVFEKFTFAGNYVANFAPEASDKKKYYVMDGGEWNDLDTLNPFRFFLQIEYRNGSAFVDDAQSIRMRSVNANGEETTGINGVDAEQAGDFIFDLHGRRVLETEKGGIYIKGGKKFIAQ